MENTLKKHLKKMPATEDFLADFHSRNQTETSTSMSSGCGKSQARSMQRKLGIFTRSVGSSKRRNGYAFSASASDVSNAKVGGWRGFNINKPKKVQLNAVLALDSSVLNMKLLNGTESLQVLSHQGRDGDVEDVLALAVGKQDPRELLTKIIREFKRLKSVLEDLE
ncbi:hypothetical protein PIB30_041977 [Stylosanthes scabra]|uniref:Uncharacterized protein n=1 Tax=Stylosanthes scabra TaxID=79078 RepID=A0ABU6XFD2_9FABA|nr:hypothetical protein [Stylosanthes scabra]